MAIDFIYVATIMLFALMALGLMVKDYSLGMLGAMGLMGLGVYMWINGVGDLLNFLTQSYAAIMIGLGSYIFIGGAVEMIEEYGV